jgi:putative transposase
MRFVEQMPMRVAGSDPATWRWSSAPGHTGAARDPLITDHPVFWATGNTPFEREAHHRERLAEPLDETTLARFDGALAGGWPIGDSTFLAAVAQKTARRLVPRTPGRPRKAEASLSPI